MGPPACACHGVTMRWDKDRRWPQGGFWRCVVKARAANRVYYERKMNDSVWANARRMNQARQTRGQRRALLPPPNPKVAELLLAVRKGA